MSSRILGVVLALTLPLFAHGVEMKLGQNLSGSMPKISLTNPTIFPQDTSLTVFGVETDRFVLDAHSSTQIFVECHASEQTKELPFGVITSAESWTQQIPSAGLVDNRTAIWISSQRQGRAHLESLIRSEIPNLKLIHLSLGEAPKSLAELDQISMILLSAGDLERLGSESFAVMRDAVALGVPLVIAAREKNDQILEHQASVTQLRFGAWRSVSSELGAALPAATRVAAIEAHQGQEMLRVDGHLLVAESTYGFGGVRLLAVPFATLREGVVAGVAFGQSGSRTAHPTRWLESQASPPVENFFISWLVPMSGLILMLVLVSVRRSRGLFAVMVVVWWTWMMSQPVADEGVLISKQWGVEAQLSTGGVVLTRMDVDHRLGGARVLDMASGQLDLKMLRTGAVCLIHRDLDTKLLFPQTLDRMTRIFVGFTHTVAQIQLSDGPSLSLPEWPKNEFAGSILQPIQSSQIAEECGGTQCEFYRLRPKSE
jgi:hypothetical protein